MLPPYDVVIAGGGAAGLSAALVRWGGADVVFSFAMGAIRAMQPRTLRIVCLATKESRPASCLQRAAMSFARIGTLAARRRSYFY
jgi:hypothetical protein